MAASTELILDQSHSNFLKLLPSLGINTTGRDAIEQALTIVWIVTVRAFVTSTSLYVGYDAISGVSYVGEGETAKIPIAWIDIDPNDNAMSLQQQIAQNTPIKHSLAEEKTHAFDTIITFSNHMQVTAGLCLNVTIQGEKLVANLTFSTIEQALADTLLRSFNQALTSLITTPSIPIGDLNLCSQHDLGLLKDFTLNIQPPGDELIHDLCFKHAKTYPNDLAVASYDGNLTYGELDDLTSRLAHYLVRQGIQPETFVACSFPKSTWAIVVRLAILKAGGAYLCIDAKDPVSYLNAIMRRANVRLVISCSDHVAQLQHLSVDRIIEISPSFVNSLPSVPGIPCEEVKPSNVAILVFTSGSTGNPKGVVQEHRAYTAGAVADAEQYKITRGSRQFQSAAMTFTAGDLDYITSLVVGACCCIPRPNGSPREWVEDINSTQATHCFFTPTAALEFLPETMPSLQFVQIGGEPMAERVISRWSGYATIVQKYGMSEVATAIAMNAALRAGRGTVVGSTVVCAHWVVNPRSPAQLMPVGAVGELLVEGHNITRGYLDTPSTNILEPRPQWLVDLHQRNTRIICSGDLARINHDGQLEILGRKDMMLKLEGVRIEPQEVESFLHPSLGSQDVVIADVLGGVNSENKSRGAALTAYINLSTSQAQATDPITFEAVNESHPKHNLVQRMKKTIEETLPSDLRPTLYLLVNRIPKTTSNKTNRKKLHMAGEEWYASQ
ncbi:AMP-dependent synthetase/ligase [Penicillium vulpinum]|uniref:AMP-dependent synthetase/ligase domain-containing protein n=1 Tax=Penicillium vulpinum TaxID=29845 RepID=A0A1V6S8E8_9EURO|nr:AMP-dependent synthetase/ligase [Penicillium vulpinum]KAJ5951880.1 AMP-dependent synthetase/ligase [Penicillium vulpinum]OQE10311.1 hypothetical protein PENVUL_c004G01960 [Penicillium vulpinum]